jgi:hypothetical protein
MKFLLFNVMAVVALAYLFLRGEGVPSMPAVKAAAVAVPIPAPPSQPRLQALPKRAVQPVVDSEIYVAVPVVHGVLEGRTSEPNILPASEPATLFERRRDLDQIARDMDHFAADRLSR